MGKVIFGNSASVDGYVAGLNDSPENGLGDGGMALFEWYFSGDTDVHVTGAPPMKLSKISADVFCEATQNLGAMICGRRMFDIASAWGGTPPGSPCFVMTHNPPQAWVKDGSPFIFVTDGVESAIRQAKAAAGDRDVAISSASIGKQALKAGLLDEIHIDMVPILLGGGVRWFEDGDPITLETLRVIEAPGVTHLKLRVVK